MAASDAFREHMADAAAADASVAVMVEEACRIIDRLAHIHDVETGKSEWIRLLHFRMGDDLETVHVSIDHVLSEARQQATALKTIMTHLGVGKADLSASQKVVDPIDEIARRRAHRAAGVAGGAVRASRSR